VSAVTSLVISYGAGTPSMNSDLIDGPVALPGLFTTPVWVTLRV
jgi:hypothetical protein